MSEISPTDRDLAVRTMIGEASNQSDEGLSAVGHVILNRSRNAGITPTDVVLAPGQFEPWGSRSRELMSYSSQSEEYKRAAKVFDDAASGASDDPTGGAT